MKKWKDKIPVLIIAVALGTVAFIGLLWLERQALKDLEKREVVACIKDCPEGEMITQENVTDYFKIISVSAGLATKTTLESLEELPGCYPNVTIKSGEILYASMLNENNIAENLTNPVEISVTAHIEFALAGRIRKGDIVNVYARYNQSQSYELILEQVVVQNVYDSAANVISNNDSTALASMFTFCVEASVAEHLGKLYTGEVAVVKIK